MLRAVFLLCLALPLYACPQDGGDPTPTPGPPDVAGTITLGDGIVVEDGAKLWVGFFLEEDLDELRAPLDQDSPRFGEIYESLTFPLDYLQSGLVGTYWPVVGLDQNDDELFCVGDYIGWYLGGAKGGKTSSITSVDISPFGLANVDIEVEVAVPAFAEDKGCPDPQQ